MTIRERTDFITRHDVLLEEYVPDELPFRENEISKAVTILEPILKGEQPGNLWIQGPAGTGKTVLVKYILRPFRKSPQISIVYVNCYQADTFCKVVDELTDMRNCNSFIHEKITPDTLCGSTGRKGPLG